jgi:hypothetical protein
MAFTRIDTAKGANAASGTTLDTDSTLNVQTDDLLVVVNIFVGGTTSCGVQGTGADNVFTFNAGANTGVFGDDSLVVAGGYVLRATANGTLTLRQTLGAARTERGIHVTQFRPTSGFAATKGDENAATGFDSTPSSGAVSQGGSSNVGLGAIGSGSITVSGEQIAGSAATEVADSPLTSGGDQLVVFERFVSGSISGSATSSTSIGDWGCILMTFGEESVADTPLVETLDPADNATDVPVDTDLVVTWDENIQVGTGDVEIYSYVPPSTAPTVQQRDTDNTGTGDTGTFTINWTIPGGGTYLEGDIVFIAISKDDDDPFTSFPPTDWNEAFNQATSTTARVGGIWRRFAAGASTASVNVTGDSESYAGRIWVIRGADTQTNPFCPTPATGTSTGANPPTATFPWGTEPTLVLAIAGGDGNGSASAYPSGYSNTGTHNSGHTTTGSRSWLAYAELASDTSGSEDPSAFTNTSEEWVAATVAFRGAATRTLEETIDITDGGQVSIASDTLTITPTPGTLVAETQYYVLWDAGIIEADDDAAPCLGVTDQTYWSFTTGEEAGTTDGAGSASVVVSGSGVGASTAASAGASSTAIAGSAVGSSTAAAAGASSVVVSGAAVGTGILSSAGTSACAVTVAGVGSTVAASAGTSATVVTGAGAGSSTAASAGASACTLTGSGVGSATAAGAGASSCVLTGAAAGSATAASAGASAVVLTVSGVGSTSTEAEGVGTSAVTLAVAGVGSSTAAAAGTSATVCTGSGVGASTTASAGLGSVACSVAGVGSATAAAAGSCAVVVTGAAVGEATGGTAGAGSCSVTVSVAGVGSATVASVAASTCSVSVAGSASSTAAGTGASAVACSVAGAGALVRGTAGASSCAVTVAAVASSVAAAAGASTVVVTGAATSGGTTAAAGACSVVVTVTGASGVVVPPDPPTVTDWSKDTTGPIVTAWTPGSGGPSVTGWVKQPGPIVTTWSWRERDFELPLAA